MRKLTQIVKIYSTANFLVESNTNGKEIDAYDETFVKIAPIESLRRSIEAVHGLIVSGKYYTQVFLPFGFGTGTIDTHPLSLLPDELAFVIHATSAQKLSYSGLDFKNRILLLSPGNAKQQYTFNGQTVKCTPCGKSDVISSGDLLPRIDSTINVSQLQMLLESPVGSDTQTLDLKIISGAETIVITKDKDLLRLHTMLQQSIYKKIPLEFRKNSDDTLIKKFSEILVSDALLPASAIGVIIIPKSSLQKDDTEYKTYASLNNFIVHFPAQKMNVELTINTNVFENTSKLFFNDAEIPNPGVADHPDIDNYKQITGTVNDLVVHLDKRPQVVLKHLARKEIIHVDPLRTYEPKVNTAKVVFTKKAS